MLLLLVILIANSLLGYVTRDNSSYHYFYLSIALLIVLQCIEFFIKVKDNFHVSFLFRSDKNELPESLHADFEVYSKTDYIITLHSVIDFFLLCASAFLYMTSIHDLILFTVTCIAILLILGYYTSALDRYNEVKNVQNTERQCHTTTQKENHHGRQSLS